MGAEGGDNLYKQCFSAVIKLEDFVNFLSGSKIINILNKQFSSFYYRGDLICILIKNEFKYYIFDGQEFKFIKSIDELNLRDLGFYYDVPNEFTVNYWYVPKIDTNGKIVWFYPNITNLHSKITESESKLIKRIIRYETKSTSTIYEIYVESLKSDVKIIFNNNTDFYTALMYGVYKPYLFGLQVFY